MAQLNSNTTYNQEQLGNIAAGISNTTKKFNEQYGVKSAVPKINQYQNVGNIKPSGDSLPVGTKVGDLGVITTGFGDPTRFEKSHKAVDIANKAGTPIKAFTGGLVTEVVSGKKHGDAGFGNYVVVQDDQGNYHRYSHLKGEYVPINSRIEKGQVLGTMGATGQTYSQSGDPKRKGEHLDYRVYDKNKNPVNPFSYIMADYYNSINK